MVLQYKAITGEKFTADDEVINHADKMAEWTKNWAKKPWLRIAGFVGNGKTTTIHAFRIVYEVLNRPKLFPVITAEKLARMAVNEPQEFEKVITLPRLMIDDIGTEPAECTAYGNKIRPVAEALMARYCRKAITIYTTNLTAEQIESQYGARIADRMAELETKIVFERKESFRKLNQ